MMENKFINKQFEVSHLFLGKYNGYSNFEEDIK